jgi:hypothetical protein
MTFAADGCYGVAVISAIDVQERSIGIDAPMRVTTFVGKMSGGNMPLSQ